METKALEKMLINKGEKAWPRNTELHLLITFLFFIEVLISKHLIGYFSQLPNFVNMYTLYMIYPQIFFDMRKPKGSNIYRLFPYLKKFDFVQ